MAPPKRVTPHPFLPPLQRIRDLQYDMISIGFVIGLVGVGGVGEQTMEEKIHCLENNIFSSTVCCTGVHGAYVQ